MTTIDQYEDNEITYGQICSSGLGPCIAVGILDRKLKKAWMIHHPHMDIDHPLDEFLEKYSLTKKNKNLKVYATGCTIDQEDDEIGKKCKQARDYVQTVLYKTFNKSQVLIRWNNIGEITELIIDIDTGEVGREVNSEYQKFINDLSDQGETFYRSNGEPI